IQVFRISGVSLRQTKKDVSRLSQIALLEERSSFPVLGGRTRAGSIQQMQHAVRIMLTDALACLLIPAERSFRKRPGLLIVLEKLTQRRYLRLRYSFRIHRVV